MVFCVVLTDMEQSFHGLVQLPVSVGGTSTRRQDSPALAVIVADWWMPET